MDPFSLHHVVDPFAGLGAGLPGDPMEQVLSLQTLDNLEAEPVQNCWKTSSCRVCTGPVTDTCQTSTCTFSCAAQVGVTVVGGADAGGW